MLQGSNFADIACPEPAVAAVPWIPACAGMTILPIVRGIELQSRKRESRAGVEHRPLGAHPGRPWAYSSRALSRGPRGPFRGSRA